MSKLIVEEETGASKGAVAAEGKASPVSATVKVASVGTCSEVVKEPSIEDHSSLFWSQVVPDTPDREVPDTLESEFCDTRNRATPRIGSTPEDHIHQPKTGKKRKKPAGFLSNNDHYDVLHAYWPCVERWILSDDENDD